MWTGGYLLPVIATIGLIGVETLLRGLPVCPLVWPVVALESIAIVCALAVAFLHAPLLHPLRQAAWCGAF